MSRDEFGRLCEQWSKALWCFVRSRVDANRADDVCQETWLRAWKSQEQYTGGNFKAWLFRIAENVFIDEVRKDKRRKETHLSPTNQPALPAPQPPSTRGAVIREGWKAVVVDCMKKISPEEAEVVRLTAEGWSSQEIAVKLSVDVKKVYELRCSGLKKLRACAEQKLS